MTDLHVFGTGSFGRLGLGHSGDQQIPAIVNGQIRGRGILSISGGMYHSGLVCDDNSLFLFGSNATGCLGENVPLGDASDDSAGEEIKTDSTMASRPWRIRSLPRRIQISQVSVGGDLIGAHTLAVSSQGRLYAWGNAKACGVGRSDFEIVRPTLVSKFTRTDYDGRELATIERVLFASAGGSCSAAITTEGALYTFGISTSGRLGYKDVKERVQWTPRRVDALLGENIRIVSVGGSHMICVTARGALFSWGDNAKGQLGTGDLVDRNQPQRIHHPKHTAWSSIVAAGEGHSLAVDVNGRLWSWGGCGGAMLGRGRLGMSSDQERALCISFQIPNIGYDWTRPCEVTSMSDHRVVRVAAGASHSVAVCSNGTVFVWGSRNQCGLPVPISQVSFPRLLTLGHQNIEAVACGSYHSMIVTGDAKSNPSFQFLFESAIRPYPSYSHDVYITSQDGRKLWLSRTGLKARVSRSSWRCFWVPQLRTLDPQDTISGDMSPKESLGKIAESFKISLLDGIETERRVIEEYKRLDTILDEWGSSVEGSSEEQSVHAKPEIPQDCLLVNQPTEILLKFLSMVFLDSVPEFSDIESLEADQVINRLLKLTICCQLSRPESLLRQTIKRIDKDRTFPLDSIPGSGLADSTNYLYTRSVTKEGMVHFHCGEPIYRDVGNHDQNDTVCIHIFVVEANCPDLVLPSRDSSDKSPARRRSGWTVRKDPSEETCFHVDCPDIPSDVMKELSFLFYFAHFNEGVHSLEMEYEESFPQFLKFWALVASMGSRLGNEYAAVAGLDRILGRLDESNWKQVLLVLKRHLSLRTVKQVKEPILSVAVSALSRKVMMTESFKSPSGYILKDDEVGSVVDTVLVEDFGELESVDTIREKVIERLKQHCSVSREIRSRLEYYQGLDQDPVEVKTVVGKSHWAMKYLKSLSVPIRGGPSLASTGRDLLIVIGLVAVFITYYSTQSLMATDFGSIRFVQFFLRNEVTSRVALIFFNFLIISFAIYWISRVIHKR
jgi:alpha-tubulin suppressor-like RCC1 family protein